MGGQSGLQEDAIALHCVGLPNGGKIPWKFELDQSERKLSQIQASHGHTSISDALRLRLAGSYGQFTWC